MDGVQIVGSAQLYMFCSYDNQLLILDDRASKPREYKNPDFKVFLAVLDDDWLHLESCFVGIMTQSPQEPRDYVKQYTKLRLRYPKPNWNEVVPYLKSQFDSIRGDRQFREVAEEIYLALLHVCEDYPKEKLEDYRDRMKGVY